MSAGASARNPEVVVSAPQGGGAVGQDPLLGAVDAALSSLQRLLADQERCPHFLPRAKAIILCSSIKAGLGLAVERGSGLLLARLPPPRARSNSLKSLSAGEWASQLSPCGSSGSASGGESPSAGGSGSAGLCWGWSAPCFVSLTGLSTGLTAGAHRSTLLLGIMSDSSLARLMHCGALCLGAHWHLAPLINMDGDSTCAFRDLAICKLTSGVLFDVSLASLSLSVDCKKTRQAYGGAVTPAQVLRGGVPMPYAAAPLARRLCEAEGRIIAAAFEPSHAGSEPVW